ncbi:hypothetical protein [Vibrio breoganii]|uniref:hypothetical protein n=1 Tax=Vibrio breoganii TaxID=553239 RepID=UPI0039A4FBE6
MTYTKLILTVDVISDWHIGSGEEGGAKADSLVLKDGQDYPTYQADLSRDC